MIFLEDVTEQEEFKDLNTLISNNQQQEHNDGYQSHNDRPDVSVSEPEPVTSHQTARMILSQLGFIDSMTMVDGDTCTQLRSDSDQFWSDLQLVDRMSTRTADTMYVYYVRHGQYKASEILANNSSTSLPSEYFSLLSSLGWQVDLR